MAMSDEYVQHMWNNVKLAIGEIQSKNNESLSFEELYRNAYNLVLHRHGDLLYRGLCEMVCNHLTDTVRPRVCSKLSRSALHPDEVLLSILTEWDDHVVAMGMIRDILMYMDRVYVGQVTGVHGVRELGLLMFRQKVLLVSSVKDAMVSSLLRLISSARSGDESSSSSSSSFVSIAGRACRMLVELGNDSLDVYEADFEQRFLADSVAYFAKLAADKLRHSSCFEYAQFVDQVRKAERARCLSMFPPSTTDSVAHIVQDQLIELRLGDVLSDEREGVHALIEAGNISDMHRVYIVLTSTPAGYDALSAKVGRCLKLDGMKTLGEYKIGGGGGGGGGGGDSFAKIKLIRDLVALYQNYESVREHAFDKDLKFNVSLCNAFDEVVNADHKLIEVLSAYFHHHLTNPTEDGQKALDDGLFVFKYIQEKDSFERFFKKCLARRLLGGGGGGGGGGGRTNSCNEQYVLTKFQEECGSQYTRKLSTMIADLRLSDEVLDDFHKAVPNSRKSFNIRLIRSGIWPHMADEPLCNVPECMKTQFNAFSRYYEKRHTARRLRVLNGYSMVEMYFSPAVAAAAAAAAAVDDDAVAQSSGQHVLIGNTYQIALLYMFQSRDELELTEIQKELEMSAEHVQTVLQSLKDILGNGDGGDKAVVRFNTQYKPKTLRLRLPQMKPWKKKGGPGNNNDDGDDNNSRHRSIIEDERKCELEAAIIRSMKASRQMDLQTLSNEVRRILKSRFNPSPKLIMERIEALIDRDYIKRANDNDRNVFVYIS